MPEEDVVLGGNGQGDGDENNPYDYDPYRPCPVFWRQVEKESRPVDYQVGKPTRTTAAPRLSRITSISIFLSSRSGHRDSAS